MRKGFKLSEETKKKMSLSKLGKKRPPLSEEWKRKIGEKSRGRTYKWDHPMSEDGKRKISLAMKGKKNVNHKLKNQRILKECKELEKQGFRAVPTGWKVIPDIIAIKDNKIFAVEVEYGKPNYKKYTDEIRLQYDDIIWIIKKP